MLLLLLLLVTLIFCYAAKCQTQCTLSLATCRSSLSAHIHYYVVDVVGKSGFATPTAQRTHTHTLPQPARNSELSCCCRCCCCSRNAVEVCGHILARMFLYQTRRDQTQRDQTRAEQSTPDQTRQLAECWQEELASFTSCLLSLAALSLLAICFEFGINFSHRTQEIEMFP